MRLTVLGGCGAWPAAGRACSGYLVEYQGFRLLVDPGYAVVPRLLQVLAPDRIDAVYISHGHPDHCADLNPLLRARTLRDDPAGPLPVYALPGSLDAVLALDRPGLLAGAYVWHELVPGETFTLGPFEAQTRILPHFVPNAGVRLTAGGHVLAYTGDSGPSPDLIELARGADVLLADASYADEVPEDTRGALGSARLAAQQACAAGVAHLVLAHVLPETDASAALAAAGAGYSGPIDVADTGLVVEVSDGQVNDGRDE